ncbi:uncharacterized protein LOC143021728 [Oratosquilla oratoria]|uniref:uncharacterized protein LOC143021728 n=1 Tax=Oratosquilla oratoria TaxID=337810 RepID=UPI003F776BB1
MATQEKQDGREIEGEEARRCKTLLPSDPVYPSSMAQEEQCLVLVNNTSVPVDHFLSSEASTQSMGEVSKSMHLMHLPEDKIVNVEEEKTITREGGEEVNLMEVESSKTIEVVGSETCNSVRVLNISNGKTLKVVNLDTNKTSDVMTSMNTSKDVDTVEVQGHKGIEMVNSEEQKTLQVVNVNTSKNLDIVDISQMKAIQVVDVNKDMSLNEDETYTMVTKGKEKYLFQSQPLSHVASIPIKSVTHETSRSDLNQVDVNNLASVDPSMVMTSNSSPILGNQTLQGDLCSTEFGAITSEINSVASSVMLTEEKSGLQESHADVTDLSSLSHVNASMLIPNNKDGTLNGDFDNLGRTIILTSWPTISSEQKLNVATQTEESTEDGPSLNIFSCSFMGGCEVQTYCDMPMQRDIGISTDNFGSCRPHHNIRTAKRHIGGSGVFIKRELADSSAKGHDTSQGSAFSKRGRRIKRKGGFIKMESDSSFIDDEDRDHPFDVFAQLGTDHLDGEDTDKELNGKVHKMTKGRPGRKRKKLNVEDGNEDETSIAIEIKKEPVDQLSDDEETTEVSLDRKKYGLRTKRKLKKLKDMHYGSLVEPKLDKPMIFSCQLCPERFPTFTKLQKHAKEVHDSSEFAFPCDVCGTVFTRPHNLERHKESRHVGGEKRFVCEHCDKGFFRQDSLYVHISMVHVKKKMKGNESSQERMSSYHCEACDKYFTKEQKLKEHRQGELECLDCAISFECKTSLRNHLYKEHPRTCDVCGKVCPNKQQMYIHKLSHTDRFVCKYCNKSFLWEPQYTVHMATHTGEKPVLCDVCGKSFAHKIAVTKHKWQEHNDSNKKFRCETCGKAFVYKAKLQSHMRSHTGEKPFMCHICSSSFSQNCNLTAHIKSVHGMYIQSIKSDGTTQTQLVKYKRAKKVTAPPPDRPVVVSTVMAHTADSADQPPEPGMSEQVNINISESFEAETAVYQIVYAYPQ